MALPTMMAGSIRNIMLGAIEVKRDEFKAGKKIEDIEAELKSEGFSANNIDRMLTEIQDKAIPETFKKDEIKDYYNIKANTIKLILKQKPQQIIIQDYIKFKGKDYVVQQIKDYGTDCEMLIKNYS